MNRLDFFKRITLGAAAVVVAPSVVKAVVEEPTVDVLSTLDPTPSRINAAGRNKWQNPMTYDECYPESPIFEAGTFTWPVNDYPPLRSPIDQYPKYDEVGLFYDLRAEPEGMDFDVDVKRAWWEEGVVLYNKERFTLKRMRRSADSTKIISVVVPINPLDTGLLPLTGN